MTPITIILMGVTSGILFYASLKLLGRWQSSRIWERILDQVKHPERRPSEHAGRLEPESRFIVQITDAGVSCERPDGEIESVAWDDLQRVEILNTADGPFFRMHFGSYMEATMAV